MNCKKKHSKKHLHLSLYLSLRVGFVCLSICAHLSVPAQRINHSDQTIINSCTCSCANSVHEPVHTYARYVSVWGQMGRMWADNLSGCLYSQLCMSVDSACAFVCPGTCHLPGAPFFLSDSLLPGLSLSAALFSWFMHMERESSTLLRHPIQPCFHQNRADSHRTCRTIALCPHFWCTPQRTS